MDDLIIGMTYQNVNWLHENVVRITALDFDSRFVHFKSMHGNVVQKCTFDEFRRSFDYTRDLQGAAVVQR